MFSTDRQNNLNVTTINTNFNENFEAISEDARSLSQIGLINSAINASTAQVIDVYNSYNITPPIPQSEVADDSLIENSSVLINQNLNLILNIENQYRENEILFPDVLSHEIIAYEGGKLSDNYIDPTVFYNIKKSYLLNKQEAIGKRFFVNISNSSLNRQMYYSKLEESFNDTNFIYDTINNSFKRIDELGKEKNIANNIHDFFIGNTFNKIGKFYKKITDKLIVARFASLYLDVSNTELEFEETDVVFESLELNQISRIYSHVLRMPVISDERVRSLNSDKMIAQIISNTSFSFNNIYPDSWSLNLLSNIENTSYDVLNLEGFESNPVVKLKPLLSLEEIYNNDNSSLNESINLSSFNVLLTDDLSYNDVILSNKQRSLIFPYLNPIKNIVSSSAYNENYYKGNIIYNWAREKNEYEKTSIISNSFDQFLVNNRIIITNSNVPESGGINFYAGSVRYNNSSGIKNITKKLFFYNEKTLPGSLESLIEEPRPNIFGKEASTLFNISAFDKINIVLYENDNNQDRKIDFRSIAFDHKSGNFSGIRENNDYLSCPSFTYFNTGSLYFNGDLNIGIEGIKIIGWISSETSFGGNRRIQYTSKRLLGDTKFKSINKYNSSFITRYIFNNQNDSFHIENYTSNKALLENKNLTIKMNPGERQSVGLRLDRLTKNNFSTYRNNKQQSFIVVRNTNKLHKISEMKDKFVNRESNLQSYDEIFSNRVLIEQNSSKDTTDFPFRNNVYSGIEKGKLTFVRSGKDIPFDVFNIENEWSTYAVRLKRILNKVKAFKLKSENLEGKKIIDYFSAYKNKAKLISSYNFEGRLPVGNQFALVYGDPNISFDSINNSEFIISSDSNKYSKNNFNIKSNSVKSLSEYSLEDDISLDQIQFEISPSQYRSFIKNYYPENILKNEEVYLDTINEAVNRSLQIDIDKDILGYTKILSDAIAKSESIDLIKTIVYFTLLEKNNINNQTNDFNVLNAELRNSYRKYIEEVFDYNNIKNQASYTVRTLNEWNLRSPSGTKSSESYVKEDNWSFGTNPKVKTAGIGLIGGEIYQFMFPFVTNKTRISNNLKEIQIFKSERLEKVGSDLERNEDGAGWFIRSGNKDLFNFLNHKAFNYDVYLCESDEYITTVQSKSIFFDFASQESKLSYIVLKDNFAQQRYDSELVQDGVSLEKKYLVPRNDFFDNEAITQRYDNLDESLNYKKTEDVKIKDYIAFSNLSQNIDFLKSIKNIINSVLTYYKKSSFDDKATIIDFVNNNDSILNILLDVIKPFAETYSFVYDQIVDESFKKNLPKLTKYNPGVAVRGVPGPTIVGETLDGVIGDGNDYVDNFDNNLVRGNSSRPINSNMFWDREVIESYKNDFLKVLNTKGEDVISTDDVISSIDLINNLISSSTFNLGYNQGSVLNRKFKEDLIKVKITLHNSNKLEGLSHDILHYWLHQSENIRIQNISEEIKQSLSEVESLLQDISTGLPEDASFLNYLNNNSKINKIAKYASDRYFYQKNAFNNINSQQGILNLQESFSEDNIFKANLLKEKLQSEMANKFLYSSSSSNFDILRFGISYDLSESLSNNKFMHIKINIVNHKYPDVYFKPINYFYTPVLTNLLPMHYQLLKENLSVSYVDLRNYLGFYDYNVKSLDERFKIYTKNESINFIENLVKSSNFENSIYEIQEDAIREKIELYNKIYNDIIDSNNIKYMDYIKQKPLNEKDLSEEDTTVLRTLSSTVTSLFNNTSDREFIKVFGKDKSDVIEILDTENNVIDSQNRLEIIDKKMYAYDFFSLLDQNISMIDFAKIFIDDIYYDVFNVKITREDLLKRVDKNMFNRDYNELSYQDFINKLKNNKEENSSYSFVIEAKIL